MSMFRRRYLPQEPALIACDSQQRRPTLETSSAKTNTAEKQAFEEQWNGQGRHSRQVTKHAWLYSDLFQASKGEHCSIWQRGLGFIRPQPPSAGMMGETIRLPLNVYMYTEYCLSNWPRDNHRMRSAQQAMLNSKHT